MTTITVPGHWNRVMGGASGWGTYRLTITLTDPPPAGLALFLPLINTAATVSWNGQAVWAEGVWSPRARDAVPDRRSGVVPLKVRGGDNVLEIQVSNWDDITAGLTKSLVLGPLPVLLDDRNGEVNWAVFLLGCLLAMASYHWGLFFFRPVDRGPLWFGVLSVLLGVRGLLYGVACFSDFFPGVPWEILMKWGYLTFSLPPLFFGLFVRDLFPSVTPRWFTPFIVIGSSLYTAAILVFPAAWYTSALPLFQVFVGLAGAMVIFVLIRALQKHHRGAGLFLMGFLVFFVTVVTDILKTNYFLPIPVLTPLGLLAFLVFQSQVMLKQFNGAFADSERYSRHLVRLNTSLERFIPKEVMAILDKKSVVEIQLGDHCKQPMAVLFADIRDFTSLAESMTPEDTFRFINSYLRRMGPVVRRHQGFVDKYLGDGIMALFPADPRFALEAALDLRAALAEYNEHRIKGGFPVIRMGIGIHWGSLMLGTIGENQRMDSTVISDTVNVASRLEGLTKKYGREILISGETVTALGAEAERFSLEYIEEELVKGRTQAVKVYAVRALAPVQE